jgi:hypothetical protein
MVGGSDAQERIRIGYFGDVRREQAGAILLERVVATGSLVVHKIGGERTEESCRRIAFWVRAMCYVALKTRSAPTADPR